MKALPKASKLVGKLPEGCKYCAEGAKLVLLVTGICAERCFYCPLSDRKRNKDVTYANERRAHCIEDIIEEAQLIDAMGTGLTGGDPMAVPERAIEYIKLLKERFGSAHHIHLYTAGNFDAGYIARLSAAGLDELRFHPPIGVWEEFKGTKYAHTLLAAVKSGMSVGIELPAIPGRVPQLMALAAAADDMGAAFLNLNELEYSYMNYRALNDKGFTVKDDISSAVKGSEQCALVIMRELDVDMSLHYCSSSFKDAIQLRNRIMRRARNVARPYDVLTEDGTFIKGVIETDDLDGTYRHLIDTYNVPDELIYIDTEKARIEVAAWILEELHAELPYKCYIVEEYPTADRLEVEREPLG